MGIVLVQVSNVPEQWTKEDIAGYLEKLVTNGPQREMKAYFAAAKIFEVKE